ncbi:hypothetical protein [Archangium primigenium]|uniref:hypothetical protein n=1 Tax=[Archangium] primigenium TaxID=2792470 RepID=UPI00195ACCBD|nr:hypothetical protein [Archangium primigenium]MBM7118877.1 hypothetical protein [Archangium primigenium]
MRYLYIAMAVVGLGAGCATPRVIVPPPVSDDVERWRARYLAESERAEALAVRLAAAESALEVVVHERAESIRLTRQVMQERLQEEQDRAAAERHSLVEHNAHLVTRQRELTAIQEEVEDVWFQSALSRARRRSQPQGAPAPVPAAVPAPPAPAVPAPSPPPSSGLP